MRLIIGCDVINRWSLCVTGVTCHCVCVKERVTLTTICNVVYLFYSRLFLCCTYCVFHNIIVSCIMTVTCMFNRVVFVLTNKSTCVIRSVVRRTDSCRYRQEDPSPLSILTRDSWCQKRDRQQRSTEEDDPVAQQCVSDHLSVSHV